VERHFADARLALHPLADDGERLARHRTVRREIVRTFEIDRVDRRVVGELLEVDDARRFDSNLLDVLLVDDHVQSLLELEAFDDVGVWHFALALRAPALLLNPRLALAVQLVETECRAGIGRREHLDRNIDEADLQVPLPRRSRRHTLPTL